MAAFFASGPRRVLAALAVLTTLAGACAILTAPATTRQGVNFQVSVRSVPVYVKGIDFLHRHYQHRLLAEEIVRGRASDTDLVLAVFDWTRRNIRRTPEGWPVVDDHVLNIITRGHGVTDQQADVFATIATYAGVPAFWAKVRPDAARPGVILSFARVDGRWRVFDVFNGMVFRTAVGELATLEDLRGRRDLVPAAARSLDIDGVPYPEIVTSVSMPPVPDPLRAELQMPSARAWYELRRALRLESDNELER